MQSAALPGLQSVTRWVDAAVRSSAAHLAALRVLKSDAAAPSAAAAAKTAAVTEARATAVTVVKETGVIVVKETAAIAVKETAATAVKETAATAVKENGVAAVSATGVTERIDPAAKRAWRHALFFERYTYLPML